MLISIEQIEKSAKRFETIEDQESLRTTVNDQSLEPAVLKEASMPVESKGIIEGNIIGDKENLEKRIKMLSEISSEPVSFAYERAIGKNDSVYSNFVELIQKTKRKVGRIIVKQGGSKVGFATGFLVSEKLLLTNWHVFRDSNSVGDSEVQFDYELDVEGKPKRHISFRLDPSLFYHSSQQLDYCFVGVQSMDTEGIVKLSSRGYIYLDPALGKLGNEREEALNIVHHPNGDFMQLSIRENLFTNITSTSVWYETDTAPGSSGSPVFNDQWQVVALHHMGVAKKNDKGQFLDRDGRIIEPQKGSNRIDESKVYWIANEGIRISVILKDVFRIYPNHPILNGISVNPRTIKIEEEANSTLSQNIDTGSFQEQRKDASQIHFSLPLSLIEKTGNFQIQFNQSAIQSSNSLLPISISNSVDELESKKLELATDYSKCKGYQPSFLKGFSIPLPKPKAGLLKKLAKLNDGKSIELKYYLYSVLFHKERKLPLLSAVMVDGNMDLRLDKSERKDKWLRDHRIPLEIQLDDDFYTGSGFDRGHMSRREDANWGKTAEEAKRNADLTCMFTNACPQVGKLNQSKLKGLWGKLETAILEKGAQKEAKKTSKLIVFNGPILRDDDPYFGDVQIPLDFYKIVLWLTDLGQLKATAFILSQKEFLDISELEELNIDQNKEFQLFQTSILELEKLTQLDFSKISPFDTFKGKKSKQINKESEIKMT
jgi:endonuclease G